MRMALRSFASILALSLVPMSALGAQAFLDFSGSAFLPEFLEKKVEPDAFFKPLSPPSFVPATFYAEKGEPSYLADDPWCIVIDRPDAPRVYPVPVMLWHEVANDRSSGNPPLCVSYCILTGTALAFDQDFGGTQKSDFGVSGYLYHSNMVMFDYQTRSLWPQIGARAFSGLEKGKPFPLVRFRFMRWTVARELDGALVCDGSQALAALKPRYAKPPMDVFATYPTDDAIRSAVDPAALADKRHPLKELFAYFPNSGMAVSFETLGKKNLEGINVLRQGGRVVSLSADAPFLTLYWFALRAFYPEATLIE